jgi:transcriptional regulator with PAS, ATPase and Fis domain
MVSQHCAALEEDALDFEIFGYARRGDGTSVASRRGVFELADGGTVFLDEVHALSPRLQMKVHRMLIEGEVFRIGESFARSVDLRVVASTHLDLMQLADEGRFRRDLAILLARNVLDVPALRDRREDIAPLVKSFVAKWSRRYRKSVENVDPDTLAWLQKLRWPGNVRELLTVIERAVLQAGPDQLTLQRTDFELR